MQKAQTKTRSLKDVTNEKQNMSKKKQRQRLCERCVVHAIIMSLVPRFWRFRGL